MGATAQVALYGILATLISTAGVVLVAILNNRKERTEAAEAGIEETLRERIVLRDEQIQDLKADVLELKEELRVKNEIIGRLMKVSKGG